MTKTKMTKTFELALDDIYATAGSILNDPYWGNIVTIEEREFLWGIQQQIIQCESIKNKEATQNETKGL